MRIHKDLTQERWNSYSLFFQLANVGADVSRCFRHKKNNESIDSKLALERGLELLDATISDPKNRKSLKELLRVREALLDFALFNNEYKTSEDFWEQYFYDFNYAYAAQRGK